MVPFTVFLMRRSKASYLETRGNPRAADGGESVTCIPCIDPNAITRQVAVVVVGQTASSPVV